MPRKKKTASVQSRDVIYDEVNSVPMERKFKSVVSLNAEQKFLIQQIHKNDIIIVTGVAGSGKTHISCGIAAEYLNRQLVDKIVLSRPQIAAEDTGYLPGNMEEKISPFLIPLYNELSYFIDVKKEVNKERIEILPIAYCRGITFKNTFVIVDEFENLDFGQLKMILTRFGENSKMILCGDVKQSDLDNKASKDCIYVIDRLKRLAVDPENKIAIIDLKTSVRHPIIERILGVLEK